MRKHVAAIVVAVAAIVGAGARAGEVNFSIKGAGFSASGVLTYGPDPIAVGPTSAFAITGITGTFSNSKAGLVDQAITGLVAINPPASHDDPLIPASMTLFPLENPPNPESSGLSYDNLLYLYGSPQTCTGYLASGGYLDVYGLMFTVAGGFVVDVWSNGASPGDPASSLEYGAALAQYWGSDTEVAIYGLLDYQPGGVTFAIPEPGSLGMLGVGLGAALGLARSRRRGGAAAS